MSTITTPFHLFSFSYHITSNGIAKCETACSNFRDLQTHIMDMSEEELLMCIAVEKAGRNRHNILNRLYSRYSILRKNRERLEVFR